MALLFQEGYPIRTTAGAHLASGKVNVYSTGTTFASIWSDAALTVAQANPIILDAAGTIPNNVYIADGIRVIIDVDTSTGADVRSYTAVWGVDEGGYNQGGASALDRSTSARLRDITYLQDYAVGDGVTDDAAAITAALAENNYVKASPGKTYFVGSTITVPANKTLDMTGADISFTATISAVTLFGDNSELIGGTITGPGGSYVAGSNGVYASGTVNGAGVAPTRLTGIRIRNVTIKNVGDYGIKPWYLSDVTIEGCEISNVGYAGIGALSCNDTRINDNRVDTVAGETVSGTLNAYGIFFSALNDADVTRYPICDECEAHGNIVKRVPNWHGITVKGGTEIDISFNQIIDCRRGILLSSTGTTATSRSRVAHNTIHNTLARTNNAVSANQQSEALWDVGVSASVQNTDNQIEFNSVYQHGAGIGRSGAAFIQFAKNGSCSHNTFLEPWLAGIIVASDVDNYVIDGNTIIDPKSEGVGASPAMSSDVTRGVDFSSTNMDNITYSNNTCVLRDATVSTFVGDIGVLINNVATKSIHFAGNHFVEMVTGPFSMPADLTGLTGDIYYDFTATLTGCTTSPTGTVQCLVSDNQVTMHIPSIGATSNTTAMTITGLPAWTTPASDRYCVVRAQDNSVGAFSVCRVDSGTATLTLTYGGTSAAWTASGTKGVLDSTITYHLL